MKTLLIFIALASTISCRPQTLSSSEVLDDDTRGNGGDPETLAVAAEKATIRVELQEKVRAYGLRLHQFHREVSGAVDDEMLRRFDRDIGFLTAMSNFMNDYVKYKNMEVAVMQQPKHLKDPETWCETVEKTAFTSNGVMEIDPDSLVTGFTSREKIILEGYMLHEFLVDSGIEGTCEYYISERYIVYRSLKNPTAQQTLDYFKFVVTYPGKHQRNSLTSSIDEYLDAI